MKADSEPPAWGGSEARCCLWWAILDSNRERASLRKAQVDEAIRNWGSAFRSDTVVDLDALIEIKAHVGRGKDKILEQELRAVKEQRQIDDDE